MPARVAESKEAGGSSFYDRVYVAERPELFFKGAGWRVVGPDGTVRIRSDASWSVPEPELTLVVNPHGKIVGYTYLDGPHFGIDRGPHEYEFDATASSTPGI